MDIVSVGSATVPGPRLQFRLLGPLEVLRDGVAVRAPGPPKQRAVLAALLLADGGVVSVDRLIVEVWADDPPPRAAAGVQVYLSKLRNLLQADDSPGVRLIRRAPRYVLTAQWVDVAEFRRLTTEATEQVRLHRLDGGRRHRPPPRDRTMAWTVSRRSGRRAVGQRRSDAAGRRTRSASRPG